MGVIAKLEKLDLGHGDAQQHKMSRYGRVVG
jgi:hypothetical protein